MGERRGGGGERGREGEREGQLGGVGMGLEGGEEKGEKGVRGYWEGNSFVFESTCVNETRRDVPFPLHCASR